MRKYLLSAFLLAAPLLIGTLGCSKNNDPALTIATGSYKLNGQTIKFQAKADTSSGRGNNYLAIKTTELDKAPNDTHYLNLSFAKPIGTPGTAYHLVGISTTHGNGLGFLYTSTTMTLDATHEAVFSGTFSATFSSLQLGNSIISEGTFTNVRF